MNINRREQWQQIESAIAAKAAEEIGWGPPALQKWASQQFPELFHGGDAERIAFGRLVLRIAPPFLLKQILAHPVYVYIGPRARADSRDYYTSRDVESLARLLELNAHSEVKGIPLDATMLQRLSGALEPRCTHISVGSERSNALTGLVLEELFPHGPAPFSFCWPDGAGAGSRFTTTEDEIADRLDPEDVQLLRDHRAYAFVLNGEPKIVSLDKAQQDPTLDYGLVVAGYVASEDDDFAPKRPYPLVAVMGASGTGTLGAATWLAEGKLAAVIPDQGVLCAVLKVKVTWQKSVGNLADTREIEVTEFCKPIVCA